jgi:hypothetical protein
MEIVAIREGPKILPATAFDLERLEKVREGTPFHASIVFARSLPLHNWYHALVSVVADGLGLHHDTLHAELKAKAGKVARILFLERGPVIELKSTAFRAMDNIEFSEFVAIAERLVFEHYLPGVRKKDVLRRVADLVGPRP